MLVNRPNSIRKHFHTRSHTLERLSIGTEFWPTRKRRPYVIKDLCTDDETIHKPFRNLLESCPTAVIGIGLCVVYRFLQSFGNW